MEVGSMRRLAIPLLLLVGACAPADSPDGWTITVSRPDDRVGPVHVVNAPPAGGEDAVAWRLDEEVRIGGADIEGSTSFGAITQLAVDRAGRTAALEYQAQELRIFAPDGTHLRTVGGPGEGPGELGRPFGVLTDGERFLVADQGNARVSVFSADSGFVTSHPTRFYMYGLSGWDAVIDGDDRIQVLSASASRQYVVRIYGSGMAPLDTIPYRSYEDVERVHRGVASWEIPFGRGTMYVAVPFYAADHEVLDRTGAIWFAEGRAGYRLKRYVPAGDTLRVVEVRRAARAIAPAARDSAIAEVRASLEGEGIPSELDWSLVPEVHPAIYGVSLSDEGDLWVRTSSFDESPTRYDVLDPDGRYRGTAEVPGRVKQGVKPVVRGDRVWAVVVGDLDAEAIVGGRLVDVTP
jgi:hypothetical protein